MFTSFFEKKQLTKTLILSCIAVGGETIYILLNFFLRWNQEYAIAGYIFSVVFLIVGWMGANHLGYKYQRQEHNFGPLPAEIVDQKMIYRSPYFVAGLIVLAISCVIELIFRFAL